MGSFESDSD